MDLYYKGALELANAIRRKEISCVEALDLYLDRIDRFNPGLNAIVVCDMEAAREAAKAADSAFAIGNVAGQLHGVPMTVKESFDLAGHPSTFGRPDRRNHRATRDALAVERLKGAGAIIMGKTNVPLDLSDWQSFNEIYGDTVNPWDGARSPGGSSGGASAALAAGLTGLEIGSDIGGSIRVPAHFCGIYGHKPTYGIVPLRGHSLRPDDAEMDLLVGGPLARRAEDLRVALDLIAGADPEAPGAWRLDLPNETRTSMQDFRIAVITNDTTYPVDNDTSSSIEDVANHLETEGATVLRNPPLPLPSGEMWQLYLNVLRGATSGWKSAAEADAAARQAAGYDLSDNTYGPVMLRSISQRHQAWLHANDQRSRLRILWRGFFGNVDALIVPMMATPAFPHIRGIAKENQYLDVDNAQRPISDTYFWIGLASAAYLPATLAPAGLSREGLPIGMQIIGPEGHDRRCITLAEMLEQGFRGFAPPPVYT
ncbi:MAG: amidase [Pseudomonadota bacterium]|nr:amidase [Pseudomonadota bacterium]